ncbi:MAG: UvrD-helicase domain-containing protein, partial [Desulfobacterales bacterium]
MGFIADLHIHSRFSRATSKRLDLASLHHSAQCKGIAVLGTGDATHPEWMAEIKEKLEPAEDGLFKLKSPLSAAVDDTVPKGCRRSVRFVLQSEISCIYKKHGRTRKNHHIVFFPDLSSQERFNRRLAGIGNIHSDGRPILGLDARDLLNEILETSSRGVLVPAHIWTPWFSLLGSKSGFDRLEDCFEDLSSHIFAVETGLSSDPSMNRRVSDLDGLTLISNSDAHSPAKLGREANLFDTDLSYGGLFDAIKWPASGGFLGTIEFFPEEGKYHLDGHRKCRVRLSPAETQSMEGFCPVCGKPLTLGVLHRVEALSDRPAGSLLPIAPPFTSLIPLVDILAEIFRCGSATKKVSAAYQHLLTVLGSELMVLKDMDPEAIEQAGIPLLGESIRRMRRGEVVIAAGYDGAFGTIRLFENEERERLMGQSLLFGQSNGAPTSPAPRGPEGFLSSKRLGRTSTGKSEPVAEPHKSLNPEQQQAVDHAGGPLLIVAGPGTGKTHTLIRKIHRLITLEGVAPENILAITFTHRAAAELDARLKRLIVNGDSPPFVGTFHGLCLELIKERLPEADCRVIDDAERREIIRSLIDSANMRPDPSQLEALFMAKQELLSPEEWVPDGDDGNRWSDIYRRYQNLLSTLGVLDFDDIIFKVVRWLETDDGYRQSLLERFSHMLIDEYQDLNPGQYRLVRGLTQPDHDLFAIGDPDQSIYGFRGSDTAYFNRFVEDYPTARVIRLNRNYRSTPVILEAAHHIIRDQLPAYGERSRLTPTFRGGLKIDVFQSGSEVSEAVAIGKRIEALVGGLGFHSMDFNTVDAAGIQTHIGFSDIAVLFRTRSQAAVIDEVLSEAGIPCQTASRKAVQDQPGIAEHLALLRLAEGIGSFMDVDAALKRHPSVPAKTIGKRLRAWALENGMGVEAALLAVKEKSIPGLSTSHQARLASLMVAVETLRNSAYGASVRDRLRTVLSPALASEPLREAAIRLVEMSV